MASHKAKVTQNLWSCHQGLQKLQRGSVEPPTHSSQAAWVSFYMKKGFVGAAAEGA